jgi:hypothetical protein
MSSSVDKYRKSWALRYIREAKNELKFSKNITAPSEIILDSARKAQTAIYYSLGDPSSIKDIIDQTIIEKNLTKNPFLRCLVEIENNLKKMENTNYTINKEAIAEVDGIVHFASQIVNLLISKD